MPGGCLCVRELLEVPVSLLEEMTASHGNQKLCVHPGSLQLDKSWGGLLLHPVLRASAGWERGRYREVVLARMEVWTPARLPPFWTKVTGAEVTKAEGERGRKEGAMENSSVVVAHP